MANDNVIISIAEETAIKDKAPDKLPLNPTAQGYTGAEVRRRLAAYVTDEEESILSVLKSKLVEVKTKFDYYDDLLTEQLTFTTLLLDGKLFEVDDVTNTVTVQLNDDFKLNLGQELVYYGKAYQGDINIGDPVMFAGVEGNHFRLKVADPVIVSANPEYFIGVAAQDMASGEFGFVTEFGHIDGFNAPTDTYEAGDILWYDSQNGGYTKTKPPRGFAQIRVAAILKVNQNENQLNTGKIFVRLNILEGGGDGSNLTVSSTAPEYKLSNDVWFDIT